MAIGFAHRGARLEHPDNTLAGFARALELGARGLESDAWVTADGVVVLDHDGVVGPALRRRRIARVRRDDLPAHLPALAELWALPGIEATDLSLDVKDPVAAPAVLSGAGDHAPRLWLCSGDVGALGTWRALDDEVHLVHSTTLGRAADADVHVRRLAAAGIDALNLPARGWRPELIATCHAAGVRAFAWGVERTEALDELLGAGIDGVYSDHVARMVAALARSEQVQVVDRPDPHDGAPDDQVP